MIVALLAVLLTSCEKEVKINLESSPPQVAVQGTIETNQPPFVILTSSISFFSRIDLATFEKSFIHDADVTVSDGTKTIKLREYSFDTGGSFKFYVYSLDTANLSNIILGENGKTYTLSITTGGKTYTSTTKIPLPQGVDSMWFDEPLFGGEDMSDSLKQLFVNYADPDTLGDYVRYFTARNSEPFYPSGNFSDEIINGKKVNKIGLAAGYPANNGEVSLDSLIYFLRGDTVTLRWCAIDRGVYTFWNTLDFAKNAVGNPFSTPINPVSNIKNGAVGVWAGYGVYTKTVIVP